MSNTGSRPPLRGVQVLPDHIQASVVAALTTTARSETASAECTKTLPKGRAPGNEYTIPYTDKD
ncbi:hypothetical protein CCUS01_16362, partial [Colletotrichum cuscutae]